MRPVLRTQKGILEAWNIMTVRNGDGVATAGVVFDVKREGADATDLKTGSADAADGNTQWTEITKLCLER